MTAEPMEQAERLAQVASPLAVSGAELVQDAEALLAAAQGLSESAGNDWELLDLPEAVEAASVIENLSRVTQYLQVVLAGAVDRHRPAAAYGVASNQVGAGGQRTNTRRRFREFRSTADFLRARLRISRAEARKRLSLAAALLPTGTVTGHSLPPSFPRVADSCADGVLSAAGVELIVQSLEEAQPRLEQDLLDSMERQLVEVGGQQDHDFLVRTARHWLALIDQETPPSEEELARFQGIFQGRRRNGLNHLHVYCTDEQHEALTTAMNGSTNPRVTAREVPSSGHRAVGSDDLPRSPGTSGETTGADYWPDSAVTSRDTEERDGAPASPGTRADHQTPFGSSFDSAETQSHGFSRLAEPSRPQQMLDGLIRAIRAGLAAGGVPAAGGLRPQVMVTISHDALLAGLESRSVNCSEPASSTPRTGTGSAAAPGGTAAGEGKEVHRPSVPWDTADRSFQNPGTAAFSGPIPAEEVRRLACDADLIPAVLGSAGQVLDLGRAARLFPPHLRKALHARDRGCSFPGCSVPGPWTEAHHVTFWERGGGTSVDNGALLCSFHHHLIHQGNWQVSMLSGIPWFTPPAYVDPDRQPLRNTYFHPQATSPDLVPAQRGRNAAAGGSCDVPAD